jgi:hypothetical protein
MASSVSDVAEDLIGVLGESVPKLEAIGEDGSLKTRGPGTWSRKQILGHLVDSALNNVQRFVRAQHESQLSLPDYDQPGWVKASGYQGRPWGDLVALWTVLNVHLAHVMARIAATDLGTPCRIGGSEPMTLEFVVRDYMVHLRHHLEQILDPEASQGQTQPPSGEA